jgi:putative Holliday junction resolvase
LKLIGLDVGDKTIGIAVSDDLMLTAQGVCTLERVGIRKDAGSVIDLAKQYGCTAIIVGLPLMLSGNDSPQTEKVRAFALMLENKLRSTGAAIPVIFQDERFSTKIAEDVLIQGDVSRKKRKDVIDKQAAMIILQSYMDALRYQKTMETERNTDG